MDGPHPILVFALADSLSEQPGVISLTIRYTGRILSTSWLITIWLTCSKLNPCHYVVDPLLSLLILPLLPLC